MLTHSNADVDAVAASCAVAYAVKNLGVEDVKVLIPEGISVDARDCAKICSEALGVTIEVYRKNTVPMASSIDVCVLVDTATRVQLKNLAVLIDNCSALAVVDHHAEREELENLVLAIVSPESSSSSELAFKLVKALGIEIPHELATLLLAGILSDTRRFLRSNPATFRIAAELLEKSADYNEALKLSTPRTDLQRGSRIAKIKCILRHVGFRVESPELLIALSEVGAFESHCANLLLSIGYDVAMVLTEDDALKAVRIVFRAKSDSVERAGIDVYNDFLKPLIEKFGGGGGGHRVAGAVVVMRRDVDEVAKALGQVLRMRFGSKIRVFAEERVQV